jgi:hypothetical protein
MSKLYINNDDKKLFRKLLLDQSLIKSTGTLTIEKKYKIYDLLQTLILPIDLILIIYNYVNDVIVINYSIESISIVFSVQENEYNYRQIHFKFGLSIIDNKLTFFMRPCTNNAINECIRSGDDIVQLNKLKLTRYSTLNHSVATHFIDTLTFFNYYMYALTKRKSVTYKYINVCTITPKHTYVKNNNEITKDADDMWLVHPVRIIIDKRRLINMIVIIKMLTNFVYKIINKK